MNSQKSGSLALAVVICAVLCLVSASFTLFLSTTNTQSALAVFSLGGTKQGSFQLTIQDGTTSLPVAGAAVVLPQTGKTYKTNAQGQTDEIHVPIYPDENLNRLQKVSWGNVCVLVYADGYIPYALFNMQIEADKMRIGPTILLFPNGSTQSDDPMNIVEAPQRVWVNKLVEENQPQNQSQQRTPVK